MQRGRHRVPLCARLPARGSARGWRTGRRLPAPRELGLHRTGRDRLPRSATRRRRTRPAPAQPSLHPVEDSDTRSVNASRASRSKGRVSVPTRTMPFPHTTSASRIWYSRAASPPRQSGTHPHTPRTSTVADPGRTRPPHSLTVFRPHLPKPASGARHVAIRKVSGHR